MTELLNPERTKYERLWQRPEYRKAAPGESYVQLFLQQARPKPGASLIDFGCGTGRGAILLSILGGFKVTLLDFADNCLDDDVLQMLISQPNLKFILTDLEKPLNCASEYGYCTDVMEHISETKVDVVLDNILKAAQHVFFSIATEADVCGGLIGANLHLTIKDYGWWLSKFKERDCVVHWSQEEKGVCFFYVTAWQDGHAIVDAGILNIELEKIRENARYNCSQGWMQVEPHATNDFEVMILGGGPSLKDFEVDIKQKRGEGVKLITLNGTYNWCIERGLTPSAQFIVDARPFNARFVQPIVDNCKYLIASQCDPSVLEGLPKDRTFLWHTTSESIKDILDENYKVWWGIPGGSTVLLRAIPLLRMLGYKKFHLYGCDSCLMGDLHHTYPQTENDSQVVIPVTVTGGRIFFCNPWMLSQAQEMLGLIKFMGEEMELEIYGDGLLSHLLKTGAELGGN